MKFERKKTLQKIRVINITDSPFKRTQRSKVGLSEIHCLRYGLSCVCAYV